MAKRKDVPDALILDLRSTKKSTPRELASASSDMTTPPVSLEATAEHNRAALKTYPKSLQPIILATPHNVTLDPY